MRSNVKATSRAEKGCPSDQRTPARVVMRKVRLSALQE
jgi:hypothetical protein